MRLWASIELIQTPYCERVGSGLFGEPLNAISNLAFVVAAVIAARRMRKPLHPSPGIRLLSWSLLTVAIGSTIYHSYRSPLTYVIDVLPLSAFLGGSIYLALRRTLSRASDAILVGAAFILLQVILLVSLPNKFLNGSAPYLAALLSIPPVMAVTAQRYGRLARKMAPIAVLFGLALIFRTIDLAVCPWLPTGTHFWWHISAAAAGYYLIRFVSLIEASDRVAQEAR